MATSKSWVSGPKSAHLGSFLMELGIACKVDVDITYKETGILSEKVFYTLNGEVENIKVMFSKIKETLEQHNN